MFKKVEGAHVDQSSEEGGRAQTTRGASTSGDVGIAGCSTKTAGRSSSVLLDLISDFSFSIAPKKGEVVQ